MAINKRKLLSSAQKNLAKGALDKALRDYLTVLEADPRDANVRLKVGDLHLRRGERDEAIAAYRKVADQFMRDGFDAKAVALYKQITKIDPKRYDSYVPLADLYHRLGLVSDAMKALQTAADALNREGRKREALEVLRRLASLDPSNTTSRLKVAELLRQAGLEDEAVAEYEEAAHELQRQGDWEGQLAVLERVLEVRPTHPKALEGLARTFVERGRADRAEAFAKRLLAVDDSRPESFEVLARVYDALDRRQEAIGVYRELAALHRGRGDEDRAAEILQRHVPTEALALEEAPSLELDDASFASDPAASEATPSLGAPPVSGPEFGEEFLEESDGGFGAIPLPAADEASAELPEGDPEQLVAEASVYLRYGKHDRAIESLQAVLAREPDHVAALEKLGEVHAAVGDAAQAVAAYLRAADLVSTAGRAEHFDVLRGRIAALDPEAAAEIEALAPRAPGEAPPADAGDASDDASPFDEIDVEIDAHHFEREPHIAPVHDDETPAFQMEEEAPPLAADALPLDEDVFALEDSASEAAAPSEAATPEESSASAAQQIAEELEEASFYFDQGMLDEAEAIYRRIQRTAPHHPQVLLRLGEIAAARGEAPVLPAPRSDQPAAVVPEMIVEALPPPAASARSLAEALGPPDDLEIEIDSAGPVGPDERPESQSMARTVADLGELGLMDSAWEVAEEAGHPVPEAEVTEVPFEDEPAWDTATSPQASILENAQAAADDHFDLAAALSGAFDGEEGEAPASDEGAFDAIFQEFKRGVSETLGEGDVETRYDLGIAYREMGLFDDAIAEFRIVLGSPQRRLDALHMMSLCALDLERPEDAVAHLEQALASPDVPPEREVPLRFDLGRAYQMQEDGERALEAFRRVAAIDPDFQDVAVRLGRLERQRSAGTQPADPEGEAYESFDDLVAEAGIADAEARSEEEPEASESVDELEPEEAFAVEAEPEEDERVSEEEFLAGFVFEATPQLVAEPASEAPAEPEPFVEPEPEPLAEPELEPPAPEPVAPPVAASPEPPEPDPAPETPAPRRRKRKISFV